MMSCLREGGGVCMKKNDKGGGGGGGGYKMPQNSMTSFKNDPYGKGKLSMLILHWCRYINSLLKPCTLIVHVISLKHNSDNY